MIRSATALLDIRSIARRTTFRADAAYVACEVVAAVHAMARPMHSQSPNQADQPGQREQSGRGDQPRITDGEHFHVETIVPEIAKVAPDGSVCGHR